MRKVANLQLKHTFPLLHRVRPLWARFTHPKWDILKPQSAANLISYPPLCSLAPRLHIKLITVHSENNHHNRVVKAKKLLFLPSPRKWEGSERKLKSFSIIVLLLFEGLTTVFLLRSYKAQSQQQTKSKLGSLTRCLACSSERIVKASHNRFALDFITSFIHKQRRNS